MTVTSTLAQGTSAEFGSGALIACDSVVRVFRGGGVEVQALQGLDLLVQEGDMLAIVGASGSGKSTLLGILSGLDVPTAGRARVAGHDLTTMRGQELVRYRRSTVGFVRQQSSRNLLPNLSARENVTLPLALAGAGRRERDGKAAAARHAGPRRPRRPTAGAVVGWRAAARLNCCRPGRVPASALGR